MTKLFLISKYKNNKAVLCAGAGRAGPQPRRRQSEISAGDAAYTTLK